MALTQPDANRQIRNNLTLSNYVPPTAVTGTLDGTNTTFTLAFTPVSGAVKLFLNGLLQESGAGNDYTISGLTITMLAAPISTDKLVAEYWK
jgi:hypothetical protein